MPRSIQDTVDDADELAQRIEDGEVSDGVVRARKGATSWGQMGDLVGTSAQQRHGKTAEKM